MKRKSLSKRLRFEIFKRDGFKCIYCGVTPAGKVLRVDHVKPVVEGGSDDQANLVTSCFDCNAGKGPVPLEQRKHAAGIAGEADKEHAEQIREWLKIQRDVEEARGEVVDELLSMWVAEIGEPEVDTRSRLRACLSRNSPQDIRSAIVATSIKRLSSTRQLKYFYGVLRGMRGEKPAEAPAPAPAMRWSPRAERAQRHMAAWQKAQASHTLDDVFQEFALAAWGSPDAIKYAGYTTEWDGGTECRCRGLVLRTRPIDGTTRVSWWIEDGDDICLVAIGLIQDIQSAWSESTYAWAAVHANGANGAPLMTQDEAKADQLNLEAVNGDAEAFLRYLKSGDEVLLRECRARFGWSCPDWMAD